MIIKIILFSLGRILYTFFPYSLYWMIKRLADFIYTIWIQNAFAKCYGRIACGLRLNGGKYISIGRNSSVGKNSILTAYSIDGSKPEISIGENCSLGEYSNITSINKIVIKNNVLTGRWVTITDNSHGATDCTSLLIAPSERNVISKGPVIIDENVWIGDKVTILPNVHIGRGAVIAANSVVTHNVPCNSVVGGVPGKILKNN